MLIASLRRLGWALGLVIMAGLTARAPLALAQNCPDAQTLANTADSSAGRSQLGQAIALYDAKNFVMAERAFQAALFAGLSDRGEQMSSHKYLAYIYCTRQEWGRCEASFDAAFSARPSFKLQPYETSGAPWRDAYARAQAKAIERCPEQPGQQVPGPSTTGGFALRSSVVVEIVPLLAGAAVPQMRAAKRSADIPSDHTLRLKVSPWAQVLIDGKAVAVTPPLISLKLQPGSHTVELRNPGFQTFKQVIQSTDGSLATVSHDFDAQ